MARCLWCGREGVSVTIDDHGVCTVCQPQVAMRLLSGSARLPDKGNLFLKGLVRWNAVQRHAQEVTRLERESRAVSGPPQSQLLHSYLESRDHLVHRELRDEVDRLMKRADAAVGVREAVAMAQKALEHVEVVRAAAPDSGVVRELELKIRNFINRVQFESFLKKAQAAEAVGEREKAVAQYRGALFFLLTDDVDDRVQREQIAMVKERLQALMVPRGA